MYCVSLCPVSFSSLLYSAAWQLAGRPDTFCGPLFLDSSCVGAWASVKLAVVVNDPAQARDDLG